MLSPGPLLQHVACACVLVSQCDEVKRQRLIDLAMHEPPLVDVSGDEVTLTDAGRKALAEYESTP